VIAERASEATGLQGQIAGVFAEAVKIDVQSHDTDLLATGLLDSLGFVELVLQLERWFGVHMQMESLEPCHFRSIARIAAFVQAQRRAP